MRLIWVILWYALVCISILILIAAFLTKSWILTLSALAMGLFLKGTNQHIELPKVYRELGIQNELFELKRSGKNKL